MGDSGSKVAVRHRRGTSWARCRCGFSGNAWAVAGHRGRRMHPDCASEPASLREEDLHLLVVAHDLDDLDELESLLILLLGHYCGLRLRDLADVRDIDTDDGGDGEALIHIRRTDRTIRVEHRHKEDDDSGCPPCVLNAYLGGHYIERGNGSRWIFPSARRSARAMSSD